MLGSQETNGTGSDVNISQTELRKKRGKKNSTSVIYVFVIAVRHK